MGVVSVFSPEGQFTSKYSVSNVSVHSDSATHLYLILYAIFLMVYSFHSNAFSDLFNPEPVV